MTGKQCDKLLRLAALAQGYDRVLGTDRAQVAVQRVCGVQIVGRRACAGERGLYLPAYVAGFPHPGHGHASFAFQDYPDGSREGWPEPAQGYVDCVGLGPDYFASLSEQIGVFRQHGL